MKISKKDLKDLSKEIELELSEENIEIIYKNFSTIIKRIESIKSITNIDKIKPLNMIYEEDFEVHLRDDDENELLTKQEVLQNITATENDYIVIKRKN